MRKLLDFRSWVLASFALFIVTFMSGWIWWDAQTAQTKHYMLGRAAYMTTMYDQAVEYYDESFEDYLEASRQSSSSLTAPPSLEMAELALHFKALALFKMENWKLSVATFKQCLKLTTDEALSHTSLSGALLEKVRNDRKNTQMDLEILFRFKPELAKAEGKGQGQKSDEQNSQDPSNSSGKEDRDQL